MLKAQGDVLSFQDKRDEALEKYEGALGLFQAVGDRLGEANVLKAQGDVRRILREYDIAQEHYQQALALYRLIGAKQGEANSFLGLGRLALAQENWPVARQMTEEAIARHAANQDRFGTALDYETLAQAYVGGADTEAAMNALRVAALGYIETELLDRAASALTNLGNLYDEAERLEEGFGVYKEAAALLPAAGWLQRNVADSLIRLERLDEAEAQLDRAAQTEPDAPYLALHRAALAKARNDRAGVVQWAEEALRRSPDWDEAQALLDWAQSV
ncbi:MAG: tetratricopeptide repeat protein [Caldilineaceae bacterium]|nr:tetratricopeptide repeat protein [Caldilineaceae bacterium]